MMLFIHCLFWLKNWGFSTNCCVGLLYPSIKSWIHGNNITFHVDKNRVPFQKKLQKNPQSFVNFAGDNL